MAKDKTDNQIEDDADDGMGAFDEDGTAEVIRKIIESSDDVDDAEDDGGFDQPAVEEVDDLDVISPEKGRNLVDDAQLKRERADAEEVKPKRPAKAADDAAKADPNADGADGKADTDKAQDDAADDFAKASVADLVKDVPQAQRAELTRRLGEAEKINTMFAGREEEMKLHGLSGPSEVISRLLHLNSYAQQNPGEYIAWVARETGGDKAHEALSAAAQHLGYKLVQDSGEDDDDPFSTDKERELAAELKRIKAAQDAPTNMGPLAPQQVAQQRALQVITDLKSELDPATGAQKRPYWSNVESLIAQRATQHRAQTQAAPTREDLARFYDDSVAQMQGMFGAGGNSAAQPAPAVAQPNQQTAEAAAKARRASKTIDGTGQGANRRPALSDDAPIEELIRHAIEQQQKS